MPVYSRLSRRQLLVGAGGITLGLPLLQSVLEKEAFAGGGAPTVARNLAIFRNDHGGLAAKNLYPIAPASPTTQTYPVLGHTIRKSPLAFASTGATNVISPVISGPSSPVSSSQPGALTPTIMGKMNLIHGLDAGVALGHNQAGSLGNYGGTFTPYNNNVTVDNVIAYSSAFTSQGATVLPSINFGGNLSWTWSDPGTKSGQVVLASQDHSSLNWFNKIFLAKVSGDAGAAPLSLVDRVYQDYKRLVNGRRISSADKQVVEAHLYKVQALQAQLAQQAAAVASCGHPATPKDSDSIYGSTSAAQNQFYLDPQLQVQELSLQNDVLVLAMACGACRIGINGLDLEDNATVHSSQYTDSTSASAQGQTDWHHGVAHCHMYNVQQQELVDAYNYGFLVFLDLISKMDAHVVAPGTQYPTLLDNSLVYWSMECGEYTHQSQSWPVVMAGSAGGSIATGNYLDYRNVNPSGIVQYCNGEGTEVGDVLYHGIPYNQWLGSVAQAMGLAQADYASSGVGGYGPTSAQDADGGATVAGEFSQDVYANIYNNQGGWLPMLAGPNAKGA